MHQLALTRIRIQSRQSNKIIRRERHLAMMKVRTNDTFRSRWKFFVEARMTLMFRRRNAFTGAREPEPNNFRATHIYLSTLAMRLTINIPKVLEGQPIGYADLHKLTVGTDNHRIDWYRLQIGDLPDRSHN